MKKSATDITQVLLEEGAQLIKDLSGMMLTQNFQFHFYNLLKRAERPVPEWAIPQIISPKEKTALAVYQEEVGKRPLGSASVLKLLLSNDCCFIVFAHEFSALLSSLIE